MNTYSAATVTLMERVSQPTEPTADQQYDRAFASLKRTVLAIAAERDRFEAALIKIQNWQGYRPSPFLVDSDQPLADYERGANDMLETLQQIAREARD